MMQNVDPFHSLSIDIVTYLYCIIMQLLLVVNSVLVIYNISSTSIISLLIHSLFIYSKTPLLFCCSCVSTFSITTVSIY